LSQTAPTHLLANCQAGDVQAIAELVEAYRPALFRLALSILDDPAEADEAAQDAFVAALGALGGYRREAAFSTWLYAITVNVCRGRLRRRGARQRLRRALEALLRLNPGHPPRPEEHALQAEARADVWQAVQALPEPQRLAVVLRYYHDLRLGEIAAVLGVTERTVNNRLRAAHARLRGQLETLQRP
jgi:RNA polymerase sigma-70 factor (ECF subfamily)